MGIESAIFTLLKDIPDIKSGSISRVYPSVTPDNPVFPCIVYQAVGGQAYDYLERKLPNSEHYRVQIDCWASSAVAVRSLGLAVRQRVIEQGTAFESAKTLGQAVSTYEEDLKLYGARQDYSLWLKVR